jgi:hypothetical protein
MWETDSGSKDMRCQWFYRPAECQHETLGADPGSAASPHLAATRSSKAYDSAVAGLVFMHLHPQEVFLTIHDDPNPITTIVSGASFCNHYPHSPPAAQLLDRCCRYSLLISHFSRHFQAVSSYSATNTNCETCEPASLFTYFSLALRLPEIALGHLFTRLLPRNSFSGGENGQRRSLMIASSFMRASSSPRTAPSSTFYGATSKRLCTSPG